jgi:hypothetical protein
MRVKWHLPAYNPPSGRTMVTACGEAGSIRAREDVTPHAFGVFGDEACAACLVEWDYAEEHGLLEPVLVYRPQREWRAHGAPLIRLDEAQRQGHDGQCAWAQKLTPIAVMPRRRKDKGQLPQQLANGG